MSRFNERHPSYKDLLKVLQDFTDEFFFIEINTVPGQSANSIIPQQVRATGMIMRHFYTLLINEALA